MRGLATDTATSLVRGLSMALLLSVTGAHASDGEYVVTDDLAGATCTDAGCTSTRPAPVVIDQPGLIQSLIAHKEATWTARADTILMWRNAPRDYPLFATIVPGTTALGPTALNANQLQSDVLAAPRVSLFRTNECRDSLEVTYLYAGNFYSQRSIAPIRDGYATPPPGILGNIWGSTTGPPLTSGSATLLGTLQSLECNGRTPFAGGAVQFLLGIRWIQWQERLRVGDTFSEPPPPAAITQMGSDLYSTNCINDLYGGQIGIDSVLLSSRSGVRVEGLVKAGAYYNNAVQSSSFFYETTAPLTFAANNRVARSPAAGAFAGEVGLTAVIPIHCNWDFRCGYFGLWLESIAQPVNQLAGQNLLMNPPLDTLTTNGGLVLQGLSLGLEGRW